MDDISDDSGDDLVIVEDGSDIVDDIDNIDNILDVIREIVYISYKDGSAVEIVIKIKNNNI